MLLPLLRFLLTGSGITRISKTLTDDVTDDGRTGHDEGGDLSSGCFGLAQRHHQHGHKGRNGQPELAAGQLTDPIDLLHKPPGGFPFQFGVVVLLGMSPCAVAFHVPQVIVSCGLEFVSDEAQSQHPAPECVGFVFGLLGLGACEPHLLGKLVDCKAKLDECLGLTCIIPIFG